MKNFIVPAGARCLVRRAGATEWRAHVTTKASGFDSYVPVDNGGRWLFAADGWEIKLAPSLVDTTGRDQRRNAADVQNATALKNQKEYLKQKRWRGAKGIPTGRGASRRRRAKY